MTRGRQPCLCRRYTAGARLLSHSEVQTIRSVHQYGRRPGMAAIGRCFGITGAAVHKIVLRQSYADVP